MSGKCKFRPIWGLGSLLLLLVALFTGAASAQSLDLTPFSRVAVLGPIADPVERCF